MKTTNPTATTSTAGSKLAAWSTAELADLAGRLHDALDLVKVEAIRRGLRTAEGEGWRITLSPPSDGWRTDKPSLLRDLGITATEYATRFCRPIHIDWRLTVTRRKPPFDAAAGIT
jgi:hypothetical protein